MMSIKIAIPPHLHERRRMVLAKIHPAELDPMARTLERLDQQLLFVHDKHTPRAHGGTPRVRVARSCSGY